MVISGELQEHMAGEVIIINSRWAFSNVNPIQSAIFWEI
jgi:hypothetical protein